MWRAETRFGISPFVKSLKSRDTVYIADGKGFQGAERSMRKALRSWWRNKNIYCSKTVPMTTKCKRVHNHVYSTVLNGSTNWRWSGAMINKVRAWETKILRLTCRPGMRPDETWVTYKIRTSRSMRIGWKKMGLPLLTENCEHHLDHVPQKA